MGMSEKRMDQLWLTRADELVKGLFATKNDSDVRQTAAMWRFYYSNQEMLQSNRRKKKAHVESHSA